MEININKKIHKFSNGNKILNLTPHTLMFDDAGKTVYVTQSGLTVNAGLIETVVGESEALVTDVPTGDIASKRLLEDIVKDLDESNKDTYLVGTRLTPQAYPGLMVTFREIEGQNKDMPISQKKFRSDKFTV